MGEVYFPYIFDNKINNNKYRDINLDVTTYDDMMKVDTIHVSCIINHHMNDILYNYGYSIWHFGKIKRRWYI